MYSMDRCYTSDSLSGKHHWVLSFQNKTMNLERDKMKRRNVGKVWIFIYFSDLKYFLEVVNRHC